MVLRNGRGRILQEQLTKLPARVRGDSVSGMIGMTFQNRERPVDLLEQNHASQLMCQCHRPHGEYVLRRGAGRGRESIRRPHCEDQR